MIIGVWGDSITYGACDLEGLGWVGRIRKSLPADDDHHVYNFGVCGESSVDLLKRFKIEAEAIDPDTIIFAIGLNDSKYQDETDTNLVSQEQYVANMRELIKQAQKLANKIYVIGLTRVDEAWRSKKGSRFLNEDIMRYNTLCANVAKECEASFVDVIDVVNPKTDLPDGLHPNAQGYQKMFEVIKDKISLP